MAATDFIEDFYEGVSGLGSSEERFALVTAEGDEMEVPLAVVPL